MTIALTTPISMPNLTRMRVIRVYIDPVASVALVAVDVLTPSLRQHDLSPVQLEVRNGQAQGIRATVAPLKFSDAIEVFSTTTGVATAFDQAAAAYEDTAGARAARFRAVETTLIALGLLPAGTVS